MVSFYLFVAFNSGREVFFWCFLFPVLKDFGGWILQFLSLLQTFILMGMGHDVGSTPNCALFFLCVFGGFLLKSHSNLLFLTPQIFDNGRVLPGSRLQVKTSRADEGPCVARLWLVQPWMLICSLVDPVPRSRLKKTGWKIEHATHYIYKWANIREKHLWMKTSRRKWRFCSNEGVWLPINSRHWPKEKQIRERLSTISRKLSIVTGWCFFGQFTHELGTFTH